MSSTLTKHITEDNIQSESITISANNWNNLNLNWMDNNIVIGEDMSRLEGNMSDDKRGDTAVGANAGLSSESDPMRDSDTLDEPIVSTLMRDIRSIGAKLKFIIIPIKLSDSYRHVLKDWDLWGPLIVTTFLALTLHHNEETDSSGTVLVGPHFAQIFVLIWSANCLVSLNYKLLNSCRKRNAANSGDKSLPNSYSPTTFQLLCVFGYCLAPPSLGIVILKLISICTTIPIKYLFYQKLVIGIVFGFIWPTLSSVRIISKYIEKERRLLAVYPIALFYFVLSWALITTH